MNKSELLENYTAEQLAEMVEKLDVASIGSSKYIHNLENEIKEKQDEINSLKKQLDRSQTTITQIDGILEELFGVKHDMVEYGEFEQFLRDKVTEKVADFLPSEPIKIADMLIDNATEVYENYVEDFAKAYSGQLVIGNPCEDVRRQTLSYLRQIAEHLLVYCKGNESEE